MKRFLQHTTIAGLAALVFLLGGCDLTELNENPNQPTSATTSKLLTNTQTDLADTYWDDYPGSFWVRYAQYWTTNQYTEADRYQFPSRRAGSNNANWANFYLVLNDLQEIIRINRDSPGPASAFGPNENQIAIATIMQVFTYQIMTDMWGPIPFTAALQGREGNFSPEYTAQEEIYPALIDSLTEASNMIDTSTPTLAGGDLIYGGDMSKWKKFANALKMRVAIRMSDAMPQAAATAINEAIAAGTFESNADNALYAFNTSPPYQNPFYENYEVSGRDDWAAPEPILDVMNENNDPRRSAYFTDAGDPATPGPDYNGLPYGLPGSEAFPLFTDPDSYISRPGTRVRQADSPMILMLYDEVQFIKAEAALRSDLNVPNITESAEQLYEDAIRASMNYWGVTDEAEISDYIAQVETPTASNYRQVLGTQKWLAQYMQGMQGWSTFRRLDFEGVLQVPQGNPGQALFGRDFPTRMSYPTDEATTNQENLNAAISQLGGTDNQGVKLWWDVN